MSSLDAHLKDLVAELSAQLPEVTTRRMFGSEAFFANGTIYALIWDGRVVLRFPDEARFRAAAALDGAGLFDPMSTGKTMGRWAAMPEAWADDPEALIPWVEEAHREAMREPPKKAKQPKKRAPEKKRPVRRAR